MTTALRVVIDRSIETPIVFLFFVYYYTSDCCCIDVSERFAAYDMAVNLKREH